MIIAFLKPTPEFVKEYRDGGQYNGYLLIPKDYSHINLPKPHGGITLKVIDPKHIKKFINNSETLWESGNLEHPEYSKYFCVGFDTLHYGDTWEGWNMKFVWNETLNWKREVTQELIKNLASENV